MNAEPDIFVIFNDKAIADVPGRRMMILSMLAEHSSEVGLSAKRSCYSSVRILKPRGHWPAPQIPDMLGEEFPRTEYNKATT